MYEIIQKEIGLSPANQRKILISLTIILIVWVVRFLIHKLVWRQTEDPRLRYQWKRSIGLALSLISIVLISSVWISAFARFGAFLGLFTAGLAIALKDPLTNIAGWLFINTRKPFSVGDRIQVGENIGDVIDIRMFQFAILEIGNWVQADQSTGRIIQIPNGTVFLSPQANYNKGFEYIWNEIPVLVTFESNWESARDILGKIINQRAEHLTKKVEKQIKEATKKYLITYIQLAPVVYTSVKDSGVMLTIRYLSDVRKRRDSEHVIWEDILKEFAKNKDIEFAYPTTRFFNQHIEGPDSGSGK
jgi:small-conductance mechanosensitive channel